MQRRGALQLARQRSSTPRRNCASLTSCADKRRATLDELATETRWQQFINHTALFWRPWGLDLTHRCGLVARWVLVPASCSEWSSRCEDGQGATACGQIDARNGVVAPVARHSARMCLNRLR